MDVGTTLRNAREQHGLSIEQLAATTRITVPLLHALETNAFDKVPSGIFTRGFIRSYAREVGLDPEEMIGQFLQESGDMTGLPEPHIADAGLDEDIRAVDINPEAPSGRATWGYALIVAALLVGYVSSMRTGESGNDVMTVEARELIDPATAGGATAEPGAVATTGANGKLRVEIAPSGPCWVEAVVDGKTTIYRLMQGGERETVSAREIALRVGDPAMFAYQINGRAGRPLGAAGKPATVTLTADSYQTFLAN
jgi:cytoskeleton protein RodZ